MKTNRTGKIITFLLAAFVALGVVVGVTGCGQSQEKLIEGSINAELDKIKNTSEENVKEILGDSAIQELQAAGLNPVDFYNALFAKFEYESQGVTIDGDTATATYQVTNIDMTAATQNYMNSVSEWATSQEAIDIYASEGQEGLTKHVVELLMAALTDPELETVTNPVTFDLTKNDEGKWEVADENQVMQALFAGTDITQLFG